MNELTESYMTYLSKLIGKQITEVLPNQGTYYALKSEKDDQVPSPKVIDEIVINFSDYSLTISNKIILAPGVEKINALIWKTVKGVIETDQEIKLTTIDDNWFIIDLRDEA